MSSHRHGKPPKILRGVFEALEHKNLKSALKRSEAVLQRHPDNLVCKAVCALVLELSDRRPEALLLCREVKTARTPDPHILTHLRTVYQRSGLYSEVTSVYEVALEEDPQCEDNGVSLFLALAAEVRLVRQQQVALQLYRQFGHPTYLHWAVATILLQVSSIGPHRSLDLAETLLQRTPVSLAQQRRDGVEARHLRDGHFLLLTHLAALRQQRKYSQALHLLEINQDGIPLASDVAKLRLQLLAEAGAKQAVSAARAQCLRCLDQWSAAREYIFVSFRAQGFLDVTEVLSSGTLQSESTGSLSMNGESATAQTLSRTSVHTSIVGASAEGSRPRSMSRSESLDSPKGGEAAKELKVENLDFAGRTMGATSSNNAAANGHSDSLRPDASSELLGSGQRSSNMTNFRMELSKGSKPARAAETQDEAEAVDLTEEEQPGYEVHDAYKLFKHLQHTARDHGSRVPFLAELEMRTLAFACTELETIQRLSAGNEPVPQDYHSWRGVVFHSNEDIAAFLDSIASYFERHGHRGGCYIDLKPYLCILDEKQAGVLLSKLQHSHGERSAAENENVTWATRCAEAQRHLALARIQRGLRALEGIPTDRAASEVDSLLERWDELRRLSAQEDMDLSSLKGHGLREELRPTIDVDDLLCLATAHLLDMDRAYCAQFAPIAASGQGRLPSLRDRVYAIDALTLLELGTKLSPFCQRLRLLLAVIYGAVGAGIPLRKHYEMLGLQHMQHEALTHLVLDRLLGLGCWDDVPEVCRRVQKFHEDFDHQTRAELAGICTEDGARSLHRSREYIRALDSMARSVMRGRATVEEALLEVMRLPNCDAMAYYLSTRAGQLAEIARRPISSWAVTETQDRGIFKGLHFLPRCTPLQALYLGSVGAPHVGWPRGGVLPTPQHWAAAFRTVPPSVVVSATGAAWPIPSEGEAVSLPPLPPAEPSGLEELLAPRREASPALLKLRALLLLMVHAMLRSMPSEAELSELLHEFQGALASGGFAAHCDPASLFSGGGLLVSSVGEAKRPASTKVPVSASGSGGYGPTGSTSRHRGSRSGLLRPPSPGAQARPSSKEREGNTGDDSSTVAAVEAHPLSVEDTHRGWATPWRLVLVETDDLFWRCALLACDVVHRTLQALSAVEAEETLNSSGQDSPVSKNRRRSAMGFDEDGDQLLTELMAPPANVAWDALRRGLSILRILVRECARHILLEPSPATSIDQGAGGRSAASGGPAGEVSAEDAAIVRGEPFCLGGHGVPMLCAFITGPLVALVPMVLFISSRLARPSETNRQGAGRQGETGKRPQVQVGVTQEALESARMALGEMVEELLAVLKELLQGLLGAQAEGFDHLGGGAAPAPSASRVKFFCGNAPGGVDLEKLRRMVGNSLVGSHKRQLHSLEEVLKGRIDLLRDCYTKA